MATQIASILQWVSYINGSQTSSGWVGYQSGGNFVVRSQSPFTVSSATSVGSVQFFCSSVNGTPITTVKVVCQVSTSSTDFSNANGPQGSAYGRGTVTLANGTTTCTFDNPLTLSANTNYYLWFYPNGTDFSAMASVQDAQIFSADGFYLDLNGRLDGADSGNISGYGTCDIYINGSKVGTSVTDWYRFYSTGTTYSIQNIQATAYHTYAGVYSGSTSGTINATTAVRLSFNTNSYTVTAQSGTDFVTVSGGGTAKYGSTVTLTATVGSKTGATTSFDGWYNSSGTRVSTSTSYTVTVSGNATYTAKGTYTWNSYYFDLNGWLDGVSSGGIAGYGTCDIYINNEKVATGVSDWYQQYQYGSSYRVENIQTVAGHTYVGVHSGSLTGTIGTSTVQVVLEFNTAWYPVYFDGNGGTPTVTSKSVKYNTVYGGLPAARLDGCKLIGWFTSPDNGTQIQPNTAFSRTSSITLYAHWYCNGSMRIYHSGRNKYYYPYIYHNGQYIRYTPYVYQNGSYVLQP